MNRRVLQILSERGAVEERRHSSPRNGTEASGIEYDTRPRGTIDSAGRVVDLNSYTALDRPSYGYGASGGYDVPAESGLGHYWRILNWRKGLICLVAFAGAAAGILITMIEPKTYQATVSLEVQDVNQDFPNIKTQNYSTYNALSDINTQIRLIQSGSLIQRTQDKLLAEGPPVEQITNYSPVPWRRLLHLKEPELSVPKKALLIAAANSVRVRVATQTRVMDVTVDSLDPKLAAHFANTLANDFIDQNIEARWKMSERTSQWLARQLEASRHKLEQSEANLVSYAHKAGLVFTGDDTRATNVSDDRLRQIQQSLALARADLAAKQSKLDVAKTNPAGGLPDVLSDPNLRAEQAKVIDLKREIADLTALYTADYPKVKRLEAQLKTVESEVAVEKSAILDKIRNEYDEAVRRERLIADDYAKEIKTLSGENEKTVEYTILKREVDSNRQLFDAISQKVKESSVSAALRASNIRIVDEADPPIHAYKPKPLVSAVMGLLAGLICGVLLAVVRERSDRSFRGPGQTQLLLNVPELGHIPKEKRKYVKGPYDVGEANGLALTAAATASNGSPAVQCPELVSLHRKSSMMAEAFRVVLPHMIFQSDRANVPRVIVFTSATPAEGKTTVACNLAIALAEIGKKVLLIDADLRRPHLHQLFEVDNEVGLSNILQDDRLDEEKLEASIKSTGSTELFLLPSGPPIGNVGKHLFVEHLPGLFARLKQSFEVVLIDAPPILQLPDAPVLGRAADGVILVVRAGQTTRETTLAAYNSLSVHCHVLGTILNHWDPKRSQNGYSTTYFDR